MNTNTQGAIAPAPPLEQIVAALVDVGAEYVPHEDGDYVEIPVGGGEAFQIEPDTSDTTVLGGFQVYYRAWDMTHGLSEERLLATLASHLLVPPVVREAVAEYDRQQTAMDAEPTPAVEKPYSAERRRAALNMIQTADRVAREMAPRSPNPKHEPLWRGYRDGALEIFCALTGESPEAVAERLAETAQDASQVAHDEALDAAERFEMDGGAAFYDNTPEG
jgi:hypothetical protein